MEIFLDHAAILELAAVVVIDVVLSGDNAVVLGLATMGLPEARRGRALAIGVALAALMRVALALVAVPLLAIIGLTLAGGLLLLGVAWKIWREVRHASWQRAAAHGTVKSEWAAILQIAVADLAMSLDNVLAVAGAAHRHPWVMVIGLALSVALMACAAQLAARFLERYPWLVYLGLAVIAAVALKMIWEGSADVLGAI